VVKTPALYLGEPEFKSVPVEGLYGPLVGPIYYSKTKIKNCFVATHSRSMSSSYRTHDLGLASQ
jgi:hypothetical protein